MEKYSVFIATFGVALALAAGGVMALQPAVNSKLASQCSHPLQASVISFGSGFLALLAVGIFLKIGWPDPARLVQLPWWAWLGGVLGTYMVTVSLLVAPALGATRWIALVLSAQILLSLVLDHFGLLGFAQHSFTWKRLLGIVLLVTGVVVVMKN